MALSRCVAPTHRQDLRWAPYHSSRRQSVVNSSRCSSPASIPTPWQTGCPYHGTMTAGSASPHISSAVQEMGVSHEILCAGLYHGMRLAYLSERICGTAKPGDAANPYYAELTATFPETRGDMQQDVPPNMNAIGWCEYCRVLGCIILSAKAYTDVCVHNRRWADVTGIPLAYINRMERDILLALNHSMHIAAPTYALIKRYCSVEVKMRQNSLARSAEDQYVPWTSLGPAASTRSNLSVPSAGSASGSVVCGPMPVDARKTAPPYTSWPHQQAPLPRCQSTASRRPSGDWSETGSATDISGTPCLMEGRTPPTWRQPSNQMAPAVIAMPDMDVLGLHSDLAERTRLALANSESMHNDAALRGLYADWLQAAGGDAWLVACAFTHLARNRGQLQ